MDCAEKRGHFERVVHKELGWRFLRFCHTSCLGTLLSFPLVALNYPKTLLHCVLLAQTGSCHLPLLQLLNVAINHALEGCELGNRDDFRLHSGLFRYRAIRGRLVIRLNPNQLPSFFLLHVHELCVGRDPELGVRVLPDTRSRLSASGVRCVAHVDTFRRAQLLFNAISG